MKLFNQRHGRPQGKSSCFKYYVWFVWVSLLFFFLINSKIISENTQDKTPGQSRVRVSAFHAMFDSNNARVLKKAQNSQGLLKDFKVFVYNLPPRFNSDWLSNERCCKHLFASEVAIHRALLRSNTRTLDPYEADFFFVPVYVSCNFSTVNGFPALGHAPRLLSSAVQLISSVYPFWNRSRGSDHVFVASHDFGACFHAMEDEATANGIPEFLKNSIILQTFGVNYKHPCQEVEHVLIPPYIPPDVVRRTLQVSRARGKRDIFAFFAGKMEVNPKNISGRFYSNRVRTVIWRKNKSDRRFYLKRHRFAGYYAEIARAIFCLCPPGWAPWSPRVVESVELGCVPVIIADGIRLPFPETVKWPEISLTVAERDAGNLGPILEHVAATNLSVIQKKLWDRSNRRSLLFNSETDEGDATWHVIRALAEKVDGRSYRRRRRSPGLSFNRRRNGLTFGTEDEGSVLTGK